jgi:hypothetical protein
MTRKLLAAAVSVAPLVLAASGAWAQVSITSGTNSPIATATANGGAPANVDIAAGGSIGLTAPGVAVTINSNNVVTNEGEIGATNINGVTGVSLIGGFTGSYTSTGTILLTETYQAQTDLNSGVLTGPFAQGTNRTGILVSGASPFNGGITFTGGLTVNSQNAYGINIEAPITGSLLMQTVSPTSFTSATTVVVTGGSINMLGENSVGLYVAPTGGVGGNVKITGVNATGTNSRAIVINGSVGGNINVSGPVTDTGYRVTSRTAVNNSALSGYGYGQTSTVNPLTVYTAQELTQSGTAVTVGGQVAGGMIVSAPPSVLSTTNPDLDGNGVPDAQQGTGSITSYGVAPALQIGIATQNGSLGLIGPGNGVTGEGGANSYGLVIQGTVTGNSLFDQAETASITGPLNATAIQVGTGNANYTAQIMGGIYSTGLISAQAYQASATAIHFLAGGQTPLILNDGQISAISNQIATTTSGFNPVNVYGVLIDSGAVVNRVVNNGALTATIIGSLGSGATEVGAIVDRSGTLTSVVNTGVISAQPTQTVLAQLMPIGSVVAVDMSQSNQAQSLVQSVNSALPTSAAYSQANTYIAGTIVNYQGNVYQAITAIYQAQDPVDYPTAWKQLGSLSPSIYGSILFGNGGSTLDVTAGSVNAPVINLGTGVNSVIVAGASGSGVTGATVTGALEEGSVTGAGSSNLTVSVNNGTLSDTNPNTITAKSVNVGANGLLLVSADPANGTNTKFITSGASVFAPGAGLGLTLLSTPQAITQTFVVLQTAPGGTLTAGAFASGPLANAPFLFSATPAYVPLGNQGGGELTVTVAEKTPQQLGFNKAEAQALNAILAAAPGNVGIESALLTPTTETGLKAAYDQLLPNQGQGLFDALDAAAQSISQMTSTNPDNGQQVAGTSLWLQEVNENVKREATYSPASYSKLVGLVAGMEHLGVGGGAVGATLTFLSANELPQAAQAGSGLNAQVLEASLYYRRAVGGLTLSARGGVGGVFFNDQRTFINNSTSLLAHAAWDALLLDGHISVAYEHRVLGDFYARPELAMDYLGLDEAGYSEAGGGPGFDLAVASRNSHRLSGRAQLTLGHEWGKDAWLRSELTFGYIDVLSGNVGTTVADFIGGGAPFRLSPDGSQGGWGVVGFSLKAGSASSYFALEGNMEYRAGEQIYDLGIAGRSIF